MAKNPFTEISGLLGGSNRTVRDVFSTNVPTSGGKGTLTDPLSTIATQLEELQSINETQMTNMEATSSVNPSSTAGGASTAASIGGSVLDFLGLGSGLGELISGLTGLFGGGGGSQTSAVTPYMQPLPINLQAGFSGSSAGGASGVDYGEGGQPRQTSATAAQQQITVQVQAMDSQSFLDRSNDIAAAVRKAMLETSSLNDVIREV